MRQEGIGSDTTVTFDGIVYDRVQPSHRGPNTVQMTRARIAKMILEAGHRRVLDLPCGTGR